MKKGAAPKPQFNLEGLTGPLANLRALAGDDMMNAAIALLRDRLDLTPEKLMLLILREINPAEIIGQGEDAKLRGTKPDTLREAKERGEFPREISGLQIPMRAVETTPLFSTPPPK